ncbi:amino acid adenylation domain-containing protein [Paenibacillus sp. AN1007]|uniref:Amino acid adenylation domain-containing protein n=1 Tax=Paenibacillus sp. AN1007 TaxID=3151385 RepID=A0AAU8NKE6_9BACL
MNTLEKHVLLSDARLEKEKRFWLEQFSDFTEMTRLSFQSSVPQKEVVVKRFSLNSKLTQRLQTVSRGSEHAMFILLLSGISCLLHRYTGKTDVTFGVPIIANPDEERASLNTLMLIRAKHQSGENGRQLIAQMKQCIVDADRHSNFPFSLLLDMLGVDQKEGPHCSIIATMKGTYDPSIVEDIHYDCRFEFERSNDEIVLQLSYARSSYADWFISQLFIHFERILDQLLFHPDQLLESYEILDENELSLLVPAISQEEDLNLVSTIPTLFVKQVEQHPDKVAIRSDTGKYTYKELDDMANRVAVYLIQERGLQPGGHVGIMMHNSVYSVLSILGVLKAGGAYVPLDPELPLVRLKTMMTDACIDTVLSLKTYLKQLNRLQWEVSLFKAYLCLDTDQLDHAEELESEFMDQAVWNFVADQAGDDIAGGAWVNSYTRQDLSRTEMDEYANNIKQKLLPFINKDTRVLEIGCASGISMFTLAPHVGFYYGTDLSQSMIDFCQKRVEREGFEHIRLRSLPADQIETLDEAPFDIIVLNSVVQIFKGHHYLRKVLRSALNMLSAEGKIFIGDVMDLDSKEAFLEDLRQFALTHPEANTKMEFDNELFLSREFFEDIHATYEEITSVRFSDKVYTIPNELTLFRYDVILEKNGPSLSSRPSKWKHQHDLKWIKELPDSAPQVDFSASSAAYILYTSGSTGTPKGVVVEHHNVVRLLKTAASLFSYNHRDVWSMFHSISFDFSVWEMFGALLYGGELVIVPRELAADTRRFVPFVKENQVTMLSQTPSAFYQFAREAVQNNIQLPSLQTIVFGGEALQPTMLREWNVHYPQVQLINMYGITETTVHVTYKEITSEDIHRNVSDIGRALPSYQVYVLDPSQRVVPAGVPGEMYVGGSGVARQYLNLKDLTEQRFTSIPMQPGKKVYRTGDLARWNTDGTLEYMGRIDEQVKIRGYRLESGEITAALLQHANVDQAIVQVIESKDDSKELCVYYTVSGVVGPKEIKEWLSKKLPKYMIPTFVVQVDSIPLTPNGKVDRRKLPDPRLDLHREQTFQQPMGDLEESLASIFEDILGVSRIGRYDSFFELGGHSLKATRLVSRVYKELAYELNLRDIFRFPSIHELAVHLAGLRSIRAFEGIHPAEPREHYPLTSAQKRLYILEQFSDIGTSYNMPLILEAVGKLDVDRVRACCLQLLQRHVSLRTAFTMIEDSPAQIVFELNELTPDIRYIELEDVSKTSLQEHIHEFVRPFNLSQPPLMRLEIIRLNHDKYMFMLDMHHLISDGTSLYLWINEFMALYRGEQLNPLHIQFTDYAIWQQEQGEDLREKQKNYWHSQLAGELPVLQLPYDQERPAIQDFRGDQLTIHLSSNLTQKLHETCLQRGVTMYMLLMAAYQIMLHKYTGQEDIIVGTPAAGRGHVDLEPIIGMFVNTLAIRSFPRSDLTFDSFLNEVKSVCLGAFEHEDYPLEQLVQDLKVQRDSSRNPLFDTMLAFQNMEKVTFRMDSLEITACDYEWTSSKFDLLLQAEEDAERLVLTFEYATSLFHKATVERFGSSLVRVLEEVVTHPELKIRDISVLTAQEIQVIDRQLSGEDRKGGQVNTIYSAFREQVLRTPDRIAIVEEEVFLSYQELSQRVNRLASVIRKKGVGHGSAVAICGERSISYITGVLAIIKAGAAFVPIDSTLPPDRMLYMLQDSDAKLVIDCSGELSDISEVPLLSLEINDDEEYNIGLEPTVKPEDPLYIVYTSGTTGAPKGVQLAHSNLMNLVLHHQQQSTIQMDGRVLHASSIGFDVCYQEMFVTLLSGGELVIAPEQVKTTPDLLLKFIRKHEVKTLFLPTAYFNFLAGEADMVNDLLGGTLQHIVVAGEALVLSAPFRSAYQQSKVILHNHYGPSETHVVTTIALGKDEGLQERPTIGKPINNVRCYILDQQKQFVPIGVAGELYISGASVGQGYVNQPELTAQQFTQDLYQDGVVMYRTGDLAKLLPTGEIQLIGRTDHQVKIRGYRIEPGEITASLLQQEGIRQAAAIVKTDPHGGKELLAFYVAEKEIEHSDVSLFLAKRLPSYMMPAHLIRLETIPLTRNGKVDYKALSAASAPTLISESYEAPTMEIELKISELFKHALGKNHLGRHSDFFAEGGHSLKAMKLVADIRKQLSVEITLKDIFLYPTVQLLANYVSGLDGAEAAASIVKTDRLHGYPLTSAQKRLYILDQYEGISTTYHLSSSLLVEGKLDLERVQFVYQALLKRHESLRTSFHMEDEETIQIVNDVEDIVLWYRDAEGVEEGVLNELVNSFICPFDLHTAPLMRLGVIRLDKEKHILLMDMHHIVSDGTSIGILIEEFLALYRGEQLPSVQVTFKDFAVWQEDQLKSEQTISKETFWTNHLSGELPVLQLPTDFPRPIHQKFEGELTFLELDQDLLLELRKLTQKTNSTLYMIMLSAFYILMHKYSGDEDIIVGVPVAGRSHADAARVVGMLVNTLPVRTRPEHNKTFTAYLHEVKQILLDAFEHQDYPLERMMEKLEFAADPTRNPLFSVTFDFQNMHMPAMNLEGMKITSWDSSHTSSKFDISVSVSEQEHGVRCLVEYATSLFSRETVDRMMAHYREILLSIIHSEDTLIGKLGSMPLNERELILDNFNQSSKEIYSDEWIHVTFERLADCQPSATAIVMGEMHLSYGELNSHANQLAYTLMEQGIGHNQVVAVYMDSSINTVVSIIAILKAGAAYLPVDPEYPLDRVHFILEDSEAKMVITDADHAKMTGNVPAMIYDFAANVDLWEMRINNPNVLLEPSHLAYVIYTSGSTGKPKGVKIPHRGLCSLSELCTDNLEIRPSDKISQIASIAFDMAAFEIIAALSTGAQLHLVPRKVAANPEKLTELLNESGISVMFMTPSHLAYLNPAHLHSVRLAATGGEAISKHEYERWQKFEYANLYGPTEATILATAWRPEPGGLNGMQVPIGKPVAGRKIYILNESLELQPIGVEGELYIGGEGIAAGYVGLEEVNKKHFIADPFSPGQKMYKTGDKGRWLMDGNIEFKGRADHQVKIRGYRIETGEIELALLQHSFVHEAVVIVKTMTDQEPYLCAFIVESEPVDSNVLRRFLSDRIPHYMLPAKIVKLSHLPVTLNGKLDRKQLESFDISLVDETNYIQPRTEMEQGLADLWKKYLNAERIGIRDNFFEMGGQSLIATRILTEITRDWGLTISLRHLYQYQTIEELAHFMEGETKLDTNGEQP